jgi:hypothetical protein
MDGIPTVSEIKGISDHLSGFLRRTAQGRRLGFRRVVLPLWGVLRGLYRSRKLPRSHDLSTGFTSGMSCRRSFNIKDSIRRLRRHRATSPSRYPSLPSRVGLAAHSGQPKRAYPRTEHRRATLRHPRSPRRWVDVGNATGFSRVGKVEGFPSADKVQCINKSITRSTSCFFSVPQRQW